MVAQLHDCMKNHWTVLLKWVNFMVVKYINKAVEENKQAQTLYEFHLYEGKPNL